MCKQAFATTGNVNVNLALTIFDRQIVPILTYGCAIWGVPSANNCIVLGGIPSSTPDAAAYTSNYINMVCGKEVSIFWVRRIKANQNSVCVKSDSLTDKETFKERRQSQLNIDTYNAPYEPNKTEYEKIQSNFCKYTLNFKQIQQQ